MNSKGSTGLGGFIGTFGVTGITSTSWGAGGYPSGFGGYSGTTGLQGSTGIGILKCKICESLSVYKTLSLNFSIIKMRPLTVENPFEDRYHLCFKCFENTVKTIHKLKKGFIEDLPLYISHNNIFIKEYAIRKIKELNDGH